MDVFGSIFVQTTVGGVMAARFASHIHKISRLEPLKNRMEPLKDPMEPLKNRMEPLKPQWNRYA